MPHLSIFNIGTGHNRNERNNLLVKLFHDSPAREIHDVIIDNPTAPLKLGRDRKVINDGLASKDAVDGATGSEPALSTRGVLEGIIGQGVSSKTERMVQLVGRLKDGLSGVTIVGHSRGAIIAVRTAARLYEKYGTDLRVNLWLLDPVEFSVEGGQANRMVPPNVRHLRIVAMEDTHNICGWKSGFKLQALVGSYGPGRDVRESYIRMPGSHGTASQVDGHPIGEVTFQIARKDFWRWNVPVGAGVWSSRQICDEYFRIQQVNPATRHEVNWLLRQLGYTELSRRVNDEDIKINEGFKEVKTDSRSRALDRLGIKNRFRSHLFFVNEHHYTLFDRNYPSVTKAVLALDNTAGTSWREISRTPGFASEVDQMKQHCTNGYKLLMAGYKYT